MALYVTKNSQTQRNPVFKEILEEAHGGIDIEVDARVPSDLHTLYAGCPIATCATAGQFMFIKTAEVSTAKADGATAITITGPNMFKVGDVIGLDGGGAATTATVTVVTATKIATALTNYTLTKKAIIYQVAADAATAPKYEPFGYLKNDVYVRETDGTTCYNVTGGLVLRGSIAVSSYVHGFGSIIKGHTDKRIRFVNKGEQVGGLHKWNILAF